MKCDKPVKGFIACVFEINPTRVQDKTQATVPGQEQNDDVNQVGHLADWKVGYDV